MRQEREEKTKLKARHGDSKARRGYQRVRAKKMPVLAKRLRRLRVLLKISLLGDTLVLVFRQRIFFDEKRK